MNDFKIHVFQHCKYKCNTNQTLPCYCDAFCSQLCAQISKTMFETLSRLSHRRRKMPEWSNHLCILECALLFQVPGRETEQFSPPSFSRPFLYKWYRWREWWFKVFKSDPTRRFILLPNIFTLINWGCYYCIKIDEVNLSESSLQEVCFKWISTLEKCTWYVSCTTSSLI